VFSLAQRARGRPRLLRPRLRPGDPARRAARALRPAGIRAALRPGRPAVAGERALRDHGPRLPAPLGLSRARPHRGLARLPGHPARARARGGDRAMTATLEYVRASRWYGPVIALNDVTTTVGPGVTGLLGPNRARCACWAARPGDRRSCSIASACVRSRTRSGKA